MVTEEDKIKKELILKEELLLENSTRTDGDKIADLIDTLYTEISEAGKQYQFKVGDCFVPLDGALYIDSNTTRLIPLSADCKILTYIAAKVSKNTRSKFVCSSVWKKTGTAWKIAFHHRTNCIEDKKQP
jgi:hypothetical protein